MYTIPSISLEDVSLLLCLNRNGVFRWRFDKFSFFSESFKKEASSLVDKSTAAISICLAIL